MSRLAKPLAIAVLVVVVASAAIAVEAADAGHFGYGQDATAEQIAGWDIDIRPDGMGLPPGGATPEDGEMLYEEQCASCHGSFGEGVGRYPILAGGEGTLADARPEKTVGSFWPYATTLWDYIHRAMPFAQPESLTDEEVYALTAYVLYLNDLVEYDVEINQGNLADVEMPNKDGFFFDDRPDVKAERCMRDCKEPGSIVITSEPAIAAEAEEDKAEDDAGAASDDAVVAAVRSGRVIYEQACAVCHAAGVADAPIPGDASAWSERLKLGRDALIASAVNGKGTMPPKGGQLQLSDEEVAAAVDYIIANSREQ